MRIFFRAWFLWKILKYVGSQVCFWPFSICYQVGAVACMKEMSFLMQKYIFFHISNNGINIDHWLKEIKTSSKVKCSDAKSRKSVGGLAVLLLKLTSPWKRSILGLPNFRSLGFPLSLSLSSLTHSLFLTSEERPRRSLKEKIM